MMQGKRHSHYSPHLIHHENITLLLGKEAQNKQTLIQTHKNLCHPLKNRFFLVMEIFLPSLIERSSAITTTLPNTTVILNAEVQISQASTCWKSVRSIVKKRSDKESPYSVF